MSNQPLSWIAAQIRAAKAPHDMATRVIGVDGCGGAGKTTFAQHLSASLDAQIVQTDDFATAIAPLAWHQRMLEQVLVPLSQNRPGRYQRYDWGLQDLTEWCDVPLREFVIIEGVSSTCSGFRPMLTFCVFIDAPRDLRLGRGLARDGADAISVWQAWQAEEDNYIATERPHLSADLVLDGSRPIPT